jgi:protein-disulfide isomerase
LAQKSSDSGLIGVAVILGIAIVGSSYILSSSLDHAALQLEVSLSRLDLESPNPPAATGKLDPDKVYKVAVGEAPFRGPEKAKVTIVEFSDFQCPFCSRVSPTLDKIRKEYANDVRIAFKHMPLSFHKQAPAAHAAAEAAHRQNKFWEMHNKIFSNQKDLTPATFEKYAAEIGLDVARYKKDVVSKSVTERVQKDGAEARGHGITGTPGFFVNGRFLSGAQPYESFKRLIEEQLKKT